MEITANLIKLQHEWIVAQVEPVEGETLPGDPAPIDDKDFEKANELYFLGSNLGFITFPDTQNLIDLYFDRDPVSYHNYDLYFAPVDDPNNKKELIDYDGLNFGINSLDLEPIAIEVITDPSIEEKYLGNLVLLTRDYDEGEFYGFWFYCLDAYLLGSCVIYDSGFSFFLWWAS